MITLKTYTLNDYLNQYKETDYVYIFCRPVPMSGIIHYIGYIKVSDIKNSETINSFIEKGLELYAKIAIHLTDFEMQHIDLVYKE